MTQKNIAIFGSTGHIGKNLTSFFSNDDKNYNLFLFSRDVKKFEYLKSLFPNIFSFNSYDTFEKNAFDVVINCIGISNPNEFTTSQSSIFDITEFFDNKIINFLKNSPSTLYINLSSGAVFGRDFNSPVNDSSFSKLDVNNISKGEMYSIPKIYSESKHRSLVDFNIIDLRIFGFFSRFIDLNAGFFLSELTKAIKNDSEFITNQEDIIRDYVHPSDFYNLVKICISNKKINNVFDVYSKDPISKFQILQEFSNEFKLKYKFTEKIELISPTGLKKNFYSLSRKAEQLGYFPNYSSLETIKKEMKMILDS